VNTENILLKTSEIMQLSGFSIARKKTYFYCIRKYLDFLRVKILMPRGDSARKYLIFLHTQGYDNSTIQINAQCIEFFLKTVICKNNLYLEKLDFSSKNLIHA